MILPVTIFFLALLLIVFGVGIKYGTVGFVLALLLDAALILIGIGLAGGYGLHALTVPPEHPVTLQEAVTSCGSPDKIASFNDRGFTCKP